MPAKTKVSLNMQNEIYKMAKEMPDATLTEIAAAFNISRETVRRVMVAAERGLTLQQLSKKMWTQRMLNKETNNTHPSPDDQPASGDSPIVRLPPLRVSLDKNDMVQQVEREEETGPEWEIEFTGRIIVRGESIDQALANARKSPAVRGIVSARRK